MIKTLIEFFKRLLKIKKPFIYKDAEILIKEEQGKIFFERDMKTGELVKMGADKIYFKRSDYSHD